MLSVAEITEQVKILRRSADLQDERAGELWTRSTDETLRVGIAIGLREAAAYIEKTLEKAVEAEALAHGLEPCEVES